MALPFEGVSGKKDATTLRAQVEDGRVDRDAAAPQLAGGETDVRDFGRGRIAQRGDGRDLLLLHAGVLARQGGQRRARTHFQQHA